MQLQLDSNIGDDDIDEYLVKFEADLNTQFDKKPKEIFNALK